jgi:serine/threonine protein kinase
MPGTDRPPSYESFSRASGSGSRTSSGSLTGFGSSSSAEELPKVCPTCGLHYPAEFKVCPRDATELADAEAGEERDELIGKTLSQTYTILRVIGEGGMGRVYEARHTRLASKRFAVKMLHPEFARQPEVLSRFQREAEAAAAIQSPHVVDVYDVDRTPDGRPFLVGELLDGKEFANYLDEVGKMPVGPAVRIVRQICKALAVAHQKGVVHRDMKPENVFLTGDQARPVAKVIDFGISKLGDAAGTALTKTGMIMGTPSYMAPEQARGERVDHHADIYAVGAILYCAVTGQRPFDHNDPTATLTAVLTQDPPRPRSLEPTIPEPLEMIIQRAMAKRPQDRYDSMVELDAELAPYDSGEADLAFPSDPSLAGQPAPAGGPRASTDPRAHAVTMARPLIVLSLGLGLFWALGSVLTVVTAGIRLARGSGATSNLSGFEAALLVVGLLFAALTPAILAVRWLQRSVWDNSAKAMDLSDRLYRPVMIGLSGYGFASLFIRILESVILRRTAGVAWPVWDLLLFVVGFAAAAGAVALQEEERKRRS